MIDTEIITEIILLTEPEMADFLDAIHAERGEDDWQRLADFMRDVANGERTIWTAKRDNIYCGMITLRWQSDYMGFRKTPVAPEIIDLYVWTDFRRQGLATQLLDSVEQHVRDRNFHRIGLGIGILPEDVPAQNLYVQHGYAADDTGLWWRGENMTDMAVIDHTQAPALIMMSKDL